MRIFLFSVCLALLLGCCRPAAGADSRFVVVSKRWPNYFETTDGKPWIPVMMNYLVPDRDSTLAITESYFRKFSSNGGNALRVWISGGFLEIENASEGVYDTARLARIERLTALAQKYGIRLKFTLQHIRSAEKNTARGTSWANSRVLAEHYDGIDAYTGTSRGRDSYVGRAEALSERFARTPVIFGWELWNEMNAAAWRDDGWADFTRVVLPRIKKLFPRHTVTQTLGSLDRPSANRTYELLFEMPDADYIPLHRYLDLAERNYDAVKGDIDLLVADAMYFAAEHVGDRPIVMNEIGAVKPDHAGPSTLYAKDSEGVLLHDMLFAPFFCGAAGCGGMWHWDAYIWRNDLWHHFQRFVHAIEGVDPVAERFVPFRFETDSVRCYGLRGKTRTMLWCRDASNNWQTELERDVPARIKSGLIVHTETVGISRAKRIRFYDPWSDAWTTGATDGSGILVPAFKRSIILVIEK